MKQTWLGSFYLILASSIWGAMYVVVKVVVDVIPPLELVWLRYIVALIALGIIGTMTRQTWRIAKQHWPLIIAIGLIGNAISIVAQETGTMLSSAQMGAMITSATPAFIVLFARLLLGETLTWRKTIAVTLATLGVLLIVGIGNVDFSSTLGGLALLIAALTWALMSVLVKLVPTDYSQIVVTTYSIAVAVISLTPLVLPRLAALDWTAIATPTISGGVLYLGIISTACGFLLWNRGLQLLHTSSGGLFFFFQPLVGTWLGWLLLGETIGWTFWLGSGMILGGVCVVIKERE